MRKDIVEPGKPDI